ncbi:HAD family hydrolase [Aliamphritea ceti]|uniref:HAD family hydrolase n=1 Tax=Aliamphritea ceti TaxID=1524258 RepID=UPI0021C44A14|nr:HAD family hydrolase [Aliamphritea ceti]
MALAIFDLDETLVAGDSASLFCRYLVDHGFAGDDFLAGDAAFSEQYSAGSLDMCDYIRFQLQPLMHLDKQQIDALMPVFVNEYLSPRVYADARELLSACRAQGKRLVIISATAAFIVRAVAKELEVEDVLAIELQETIDSETSKVTYSGEVAGIPSFREGKIIRLKAWLEEQGESMDGAYFYSDSMNDLPLLELVEHPVATNPDKSLSELATSRGWQLIRWPAPAFAASV